MSLGVSGDVKGNDKRGKMATPNDISYLTLSGVQMLRRVALVWRANSQRETDMDGLVQVLRDFQ